MLWNIQVSVNLKQRWKDNSNMSEKELLLPVNLGGGYKLITKQSEVNHSTGKDYSQLENI